MKRLVILVLALLCILGCANAKNDDIKATVTAHKVNFSFKLSGENFAYVEVKTDSDVGRQLLYSKNGQFSGSCALPNCYDQQRLVINVMRISGKHVYQYVGKTVKAKDPGTAAKQDKSVDSESKARNVKITMGEKGFDYSFRAVGRSEVFMSVRAAQETHMIRLYAGPNFTYSGHVDLPLCFPDDSVKIELLTVNSSITLYEGYHRTVIPPPPVTSEKNESGRLKGVTVCIDPGHQRETQIETVPTMPGGSEKTKTTPGMAQGVVTRRMESIVVLEISQLLRNALLAEGADVIMTREVQDTFVGMVERADIPNKAKADFVLRIHCNYTDNEKTQGIEVFCPKSSSYAKAVASEKAYTHMAGTLLKAMQTATGQSKGKFQLNNKYVGNNYSKMPSFLVELGFLSNYKEDLLVSLSPQYRAKLVNGMVEGVYQLAVYRGLVH